MGMERKELPTRASKKRSMSRGNKKSSKEAFLNSTCEMGMERKELPTRASKKRFTMQAKRVL
jgi:hypothetical protein